LKVTFGTALPRVGEVALDTRVLAFTAIIALTTGLLSAFLPAWQLSGRDANDALKTGLVRGNSSSGEGRVRNLLVVSEVALALMLLIGAGLLMRSLAGLRSVDPGFDRRNVLTATVDIPEAKYSTPEQRNQFFARALQNVRALPGVESAAWIDTLPLQGGSTQYVIVEGMPPMKESELPVVAVRLPSPGYFHAARIQMRAGRDFTDRWIRTAARGNRQREHRQEVLAGAESAREAHHVDDDDQGSGRGGRRRARGQDRSAGCQRSGFRTAIYAAAAQYAYGGSTLAVRTTTDPRNLTRAMVSGFRPSIPEQPVLDIATLDEVVEKSLGQRPLAMLLLAGFAALALASVGIYSVLAYTVRQRVREIGIRMALGAPARGVLRLVVIEGLKPTLISVALGLVLAAVLGRVMTTLLYGVSQHDPGTFSAVAVIMLAVGVVATLLPAYRATRVDPVVTLRAE
jgi:putative ABC transport system permease protein